MKTARTTRTRQMYAPTGNFMDAIVGDAPNRDVRQAPPAGPHDSLPVLRKLCQWTPHRDGAHGQFDPAKRLRARKWLIHNSYGT